MGKALVNGRRGCFAGANLFADALEDQHVRVHAHTDGENDSGNAWQGERGSGVAEEAKQDDQVQKQRQVGVDARAPVVNEHEGHDHEHADDGSGNAFANGVGAQRSTYGAVLKEDERSRQSAGAQHLGEHGDFVFSKCAFDFAGVADAALDDGDFADAAAHDDGHVLADIGAGVIPEAVAGFVSKRKMHGALAGVGVDAGIGGAEVAAGDDRGALDDKDLVGVGAGSHVAGAMQDLLVGREGSVDAGQCRCLIGKSLAVAHDSVNLKPGRGLDHGLDLVEIADARQLHQNLVLAQAIGRNQRLERAQSVDAIADSFNGLRNSFLFQVLFDYRLHGQGPGVVGAAGIDVVLVRELLIEQGAHVAGLCRGSSIDLDELGLVGIGLDHLGIRHIPGFESVLDTGQGTVGFVADRFRDLHLQNEVHATLQIEAQMNAIGDGGPQGLATESRRNPEDAIEADQQHGEDQGNFVFEIFLHDFDSLVRRPKAHPVW